MMTITLGNTFIHREKKEEVESRTTLNQLKNDTYSSQTLMLHTRLKESGFAYSTSLIHEKPTQPQHRPSSSLRRFQIASQVVIACLPKYERKPTLKNGKENFDWTGA